MEFIPGVAGQIHRTHSYSMDVLIGFIIGSIMVDTVRPSTQTGGTLYEEKELISRVVNRFTHERGISTLITSFVDRIQPQDRLDLLRLVNAWCDINDEDHVPPEDMIHISNWDTSLITDMSELFQFKRNFNDDISQWDTSNVTGYEFDVL